MNKVTKRIITISVIVIVFGGLAYPKVKPLFNSENESSVNNMQQNRLMVEAVELDYESIQDRIFSSGTIQADEVVELSSEASGLITNISFREGAEVEEGDLLLKINDSELQAQRERATFRLNLAEQREERQQRLLERGGISQDDYDATLNEVNVLRSEINLIDAQVDRTELRAPFSGVIGLRYVSTGSYITPGARIASLQKVNPVKIDFSVPERYISRVQVGDKVNFNVQGVDSLFIGEVYAIEPRIDTQTRTLQIRAVSENPDMLLFPGAFANITLILEQIDDAIMVPSISLIPELNSQKLLLARSGKVEEVQVQTGIRTSNKVQILDGVARGDTVLTTGLLQARPGDDIEISNLERGSEYE